MAHPLYSHNEYLPNMAHAPYSYDKRLANIAHYPPRPIRLANMEPAPYLICMMNEYGAILPHAHILCEYGACAIFA